MKSNFMSKTQVGSVFKLNVHQLSSSRFGAVVAAVLMSTLRSPLPDGWLDSHSVDTRHCRAESGTPESLVAIFGVRKKYFDCGPAHQLWVVNQLSWGDQWPV